jgi:hypothetical protein
VLGVFSILSSVALELRRLSMEPGGSTGQSGTREIPPLRPVRGELFEPSFSLLMQVDLIRHLRLAEEV